MTNTELVDIGLQDCEVVELLRDERNGRTRLFVHALYQGRPTLRLAVRGHPNGRWHTERFGPYDLVVLRAALDAYDARERERLCARPQQAAP